MDDWLAGEQKRAVLRNIAAYRDLCRRVRRGSNGGLIFGGIMLAIWYGLFGSRNDFGVFSLVYLGLTAFEFAAALWNKLAPSAEGVFIDGLVLFAFGAANLARVYFAWQAGGRPPVLSVLFAGYWMFQGYNHLKTYGMLRRAFAERPTAEHLRWFDDLIAEVKRADPTADPDALDLPTRPPFRGKLLGDTAVFVQGGSHEVLILAREGVEITRRPAKHPDNPPTGTFLVHGEAVGDFPLDPDNWRNYAAWKTAGGDPPAPVAYPANT